MLVTVHVLLLALAFVCFLLAAGGVPSRIQWLPIGLALWVLTLIV